VLWRLKNARLDETDVAAVPGTDVLLLTLESGGKTRLEAADIMTGDRLWRSDKVRGSVMQTAFDPETHLLAAVLVRDAHGRAREGFKKKPVVHVFDLAAGEELWHRELESEIEMMPALGGGDAEGDDVDYTLDNYRPPAFFMRALPRSTRRRAASGGAKNSTSTKTASRSQTPTRSPTSATSTFLAAATSAQSRARTATPHGSRKIWECRRR
jgi:outer membrane protein assembly factor BamB